jgi:hypothetical protein
MAKPEQKQPKSLEEYLEEMTPEATCGLYFMVLATELALTRGDETKGEKASARFLDRVNSLRGYSGYTQVQLEDGRILGTDPGRLFTVKEATEARASFSVAVSYPESADLIASLVNPELKASFDLNKKK